ncbi:MAG: T9SS type A sorting domain-containing protein, partial [Bacteroidales bacterium]|nr:T9SS type A sorting domain-containing protein [Bacteroidales bacterium]
VAAPAGENAVPYFYYNGTIFQLERTISGHSPAYDNDLSYWNAQPNGDRVLMMGYEWDYGYNVAGVWDSTTNHVGVIYNGKTGKVETKLHSKWPRIDPLNAEENIGYGTRGYAISYDGTVVGGHGTWPVEDIYSNNQTMFWDLVDFATTGQIYTYAVENYDFAMSDLTGANSDGSVLVGYNEMTTHGLIIYYNRAQKSFTLDTIAPLPGFDNLFFNTVDDNGLIFGYCGMQADPSTRKAIVYSEETGLIDLKTYLYEYYDITIPNDLGCPTYTAMDGSILAGFFFDRGYTIPWFIQFDSQRILPRARDLVAKAASSGPTVRLTWQRPLPSAHTLTGYEIYVDDNQTPIATLGADALSYNDASAKNPGAHVYYIVAVYGTEKAGRANSNTVQTIGEGETFPVQQISHRLQYNRYASIYWGLPSSEVVTNAVSRATSGEKGKPDLAPAASFATMKTRPVPASDAKYLNPSLDYINDVDMQMYNGYVGIQLGDSSYVASWSGNGIRILDQYNKVTEWRPKGLNDPVLSMVYFEDEQLLYCGSLQNVYVLDLNDREQIINVFECPSRHLCYMPDFEFNGTKGVLMAGGWDSCAFYTLDGQYLGNAGFDFADLAVTGTAYHDGKLYAASQTGKYTIEIYTFDVASRKQLGEPIQPVEDPAIYKLLSLDGEVTSVDDLAVAGGLTISKLEDGTVALSAGFQCSYITSRLILLELESAPDRTGYTLYRNGVAIAENMHSRHFDDELSQPGTYKYEVKALSSNGEAPLSPATTITIDTYGGCLPAKDLKARETNQWVVLDWDVPTSDTTSGLIGFSVFRDGKKLKDLWGNEAMVYYNDLSDLKLGTPYTYRVDAVYNSGCKASDSVQITLTNEGVAMAPFGLRVNYTKSATFTESAKTFDATAMWETPLFEEPLTIGYGTGQMIAIAGWGDEDPLSYWALIGWDADDLDLYKDLFLVGMEYMLGDNTKTFDALVYLNSELVLSDRPKRTQAKAWQTLYFSQSFPMNQPKEVALGYHITYSAGATPVTIDLSENRRFYSDIISFDGATWTCLADGDIPGSWPIHALVARKRDLDAATSNGVLNPELLEGKLIRLENPTPMQYSLKPTSTQTMAMPSPKAPLTLKGFNLYRQRVDIDNQEEIQLNSELMTTFSYKEAAPLPEGDYDYTVEAVYATTNKPATISVTLSDVSTEGELNGMTLTLYPNPASEIVYVNGEYSQLEMLDLGGRVLRRLPAAPQIDLNGLTPGTYFFRFTDEAGRKATYTVVVK